MLSSFLEYCVDYSEFLIYSQLQKSLRSAVGKCHVSRKPAHHLLRLSIAVSLGLEQIKLANQIDTYEEMYMFITK